MNFLKNLIKGIEIANSINRTVKQRNGSNHYKMAIADGLRNGSTESAKIMAKWRWETKKNK